MAAAGGFWQSFRQSHFNSQIREKNSEIIRLQQESFGAITGGDSFAEMAIQIPDPKTGAVAMPLFIHHGKFPLYDVKARVVDVGETKRLFEANNNAAAMVALNGTNLNVGNLTPGFAIGPVTALEHPSGQDFKYNIFFVARNGAWIQQLRMSWVGNGWARANRISGLSEGKVLLEEISDNYPRGQSGEVDWDEKPHPSATPNP